MKKGTTKINNKLNTKQKFLNIKNILIDDKNQSKTYQINLKVRHNSKRVTYIEIYNK